MARSLSEKAYHHIRRLVFIGELALGARLVNRKLAAQLGTSFVPVREVISRLASEGVVEQIFGAAVFVRKFDRQEISEIYDVREQFELFAAGETALLMTSHELDELSSRDSKASRKLVREQLRFGRESVLRFFDQRAKEI